MIDGKEYGVVVLTNDDNNVLSTIIAKITEIPENLEEIIRKIKSETPEWQTGDIIEQLPFDFIELEFSQAEI